MLTQEKAKAMLNLRAETKEKVRAAIKAFMEIGQCYTTGMTAEQISEETGHSIEKVSRAIQLIKRKQHG